MRARAGVVAGGSPERRRPGGWRVLTPTVVLLSGSLFAVSAISSDGTDLRPGITDLTTLVSSEAEQYEQLRSRVEELTADVNDLTDRLADRDVARVQGRIEEYADPAGLVPVEGEGVTITLTDSPLGVDAGRRRGGDDPGPARRVDDRHQVRGALGDPARGALPAAVRHLGRW